MRVLCVCKMGRNRSRYLAEYLREQGHETKHVGVSRRADEQLRQEHVDWAEVIISVRESIREQVIISNHLVDKRTIALNVHDNPLLIGPGALACRIFYPSKYQERHVYSRLREQLAPHLPLVRREEPLRDQPAVEQRRHIVRTRPAPIPRARSFKPRRSHLAA